MTPEEIMKNNGIGEEDLIVHWEAYRQLSVYSSEKKLNAFPADKRKSIAEFYEDMRKAGFYPTRPIGESMKFLKTKTPAVEKPPRVEKVSHPACKFGECRGCQVAIYPEKSNCEIRTREWLKGIENILSVQHRPKGEGEELANQMIEYMNHDFMGGIK